MTAAPVTDDDYAAWLLHPVTEWVLSALDARSQQQRDHWNEVSWESGKADPTMLMELKVRADTLVAMREASYHDMCDALGQDPVADSR